MNFVAKVRWNKALWLYVPSHMTSFNHQSECFNLEKSNYGMLKFVYDILACCEWWAQIGKLQKANNETK